MNTGRAKMVVTHADVALWKDRMRKREVVEAFGTKWIVTGWSYTLDDVEWSTNTVELVQIITAEDYT